MHIQASDSSDCNVADSLHSNPPLYPNQLARISEERVHKLISFVRSGTGITNRNISPSEEKTIGRKNTSASMANSKYSMSNKLMSVKPNPVYCNPHSKGDIGVSSLQLSGIDVAGAPNSKIEFTKNVSNWEATIPAMEESDRDITHEKRRTDNFKKRSNGHLLRNATLGAPIKNGDTDLAEDSIGLGVNTVTNNMTTGNTMPAIQNKHPASTGPNRDSVSKNFIKEALNFSLPGKELVIKHQDFILCQKLSASGKMKSILVKRNKSVHGTRLNRSSTSGSKKVRFSKNKIQIEYELEEECVPGRRDARHQRNRSQE
jgi:hypothetical protein